MLARMLATAAAISACTFSATVLTTATSTNARRIPGRARAGGLPRWACLQGKPFGALVQLRGDEISPAPTVPRAQYSGAVVGGAGGEFARNGLGL